MGGENQITSISDSYSKSKLSRLTVCQAMKTKNKFTPENLSLTRTCLTENFCIRKLVSHKQKFIKIEIEFLIQKIHFKDILNEISQKAFN